MPLCLHHHPAALFSWKSFPINKHQCKSYSLYHQFTAGKVDSNFSSLEAWLSPLYAVRLYKWETLQMGLDYQHLLRFVYHRCTNNRLHALTPIMHIPRHRSTVHSSLLEAVQLAARANCMPSHVPKRHTIFTNRY